MGIEKISQETGVMLNYDVRFQEVYYPAAMRLKKFDVVQVALDVECMEGNGLSNGKKGRSAYCSVVKIRMK